VNWCGESSTCTGPLPLALTQTARKRSPVERFFRLSMGELLTLGTNCSLFALKSAHHSRYYHLKSKGM
jgi:hypothetical protein